MKRLLAILLTLALLAAMCTACKKTDKTDDQAASESLRASGDAADPDESRADGTAPAATDGDDTVYLNYNGLRYANFTQDDMIHAEGGEPDFTIDQDDGKLCGYNDREFLGISFGQVQYHFHDGRITVTGNYTSNGETDEQALEKIRAAMTAVYGEPSDSVASDGNHIYTWHDSTKNYAYCNIIVPGSLQLTFCFVEQG